MWKLKQSKFKNAYPKIPKKEEWIGEISANSLLHSCGNHIKASASHLVFSTDTSGGSSLTVLPLATKGRQDLASFNQIHAHADYVTDFDFSACDGCLLATCSQDCSVKIWRLPAQVGDSVNNAERTIANFNKKVENVVWHPCTDGVLAVTSENVVKIYDVTSGQEQYSIASHGDQVQSASWKLDGTLMISSCRDKKLRILDQRTQTVAQEAAGHESVKDSRALWLGDMDLVLSSGFDSTRQREVAVRDTRMGLKSVASQSFDTSSGVLMPLFDADTNMLFLAGQGDTTIRYLEVSNKDPYLTLSCTDTVEQIKGVAMVPKLALDIMSGEVNRIILLTRNSVIPLPYIVPRKSYREFHEDLFPDTLADESALTAQQWFSGDNTQKKRVSLNPSKVDSSSRVASSNYSTAASKPVQASHTSSAPSSVKKSPTTNSRQVHTSSSAETVMHDNVAPSVVLRDIKVKPFAGVRQSKFRHLTGTALHKSLHIDNIRNISHSVPGESDMFHANKLFCAVPLGGSGGLIAILKTEEPCRLADTGTPMVQNASHVTDFVFDPFDDHRLVVACDDAIIRVWQLPDTVTDTLTEPTKCLHGHTEKLYFVRFHPLAKDILISAAYDMTVRIWNLETETTEIQLDGHSDTIFGIGWSPDGTQCATFCKDAQIRLYQPRSTHLPVKVGKGPEGTRGGRVVWVCDAKYLLVTGFDKSSTRCISIYDVTDPSSALSSVDIDVTPSILIPHYDADSSTLFLTGRGDTSVRAFEVSDEFPHLFALSDVSTSSPHQGLAFLPKNEIDVKSVEFAKALRLTSNSIEPISFTVPRIKREYFQDDIFPSTKVTWEATVSAAEWLSGVDKPQRVISLRPQDMKTLSEAPVEAPKPKKYEDFHQYQKTYKTDEEKRDELVSAITNKLGVQDSPLPQELNEGVDSDEWED